MTHKLNVRFDAQPIRIRTRSECHLSALYVECRFSQKADIGADPANGRKVRIADLRRRAT